MNNTKNGSSDKPLSPQGKEKDVAVYLDFENLYVSLKTTVKMEPNFDVLMEKCREFGRVTVARAYADWSEFTRVLTSQMFANGFEPIYVPTRKFYDAKTRAEARKNSVDIHITIDIVKALYQHENVDVYILISGDRDYVPLINQARQRGKEVYAIGVAGCTSNELSVAVDEMLFYHQLLEDDRGGSHEEVDVYNQLMRAIRIARRRGYPTTLGILKPIMRELIEGFNERNFRNARGQQIQKFKDLVVEAQQRRMVRLVTNGASTEVFLFGEDPEKVAAEARREALIVKPERDRGDRPDRGDRRGRHTRGDRGRRPERTVSTSAQDSTDSDLPPMPGAVDNSAEEQERALTDDVLTGDETVGFEPPDLDTAAEETVREESPRPARGSRGPRHSPRAAQPEASWAAPAEPVEPAAEAPVVEEEQLTGLSLNEGNWEVVKAAMDAFGARHPSPRKLVSALRELREAGRFQGASPTDRDLEDLIRQAVEQGRLEKVRKGFSTIYTLRSESATGAPGPGE